jgi:hypothetical protein
MKIYFKRLSLNNKKMNKNYLIQLLFSVSIVLTACSSTPSTPEGVACKEMRETQELIRKEISSDFQERIDSGTGGRISENLLDQHLSAYKGIANRYTSKVNDPALKDQLRELSNKAGGPKEEAGLTARAQLSKIVGWCKSKKY